jgi:hypothetical protein
VRFLWKLSQSGSSAITGTLVLAKTGSTDIVGGCNITGTIVSLTK